VFTGEQVVTNRGKAGGVVVGDVAGYTVIFLKRTIFHTGMVAPIKTILNLLSMATTIVVEYYAQLLVFSVFSPIFKSLNLPNTSAISDY
jgi:hypothetical protein